MKKHHLFAILFLVFAFGMSSSVFAYEGEDDFLDTDERMEVRIKANMDIEAILRSQKVRLDAQREKMKAEAETRKANAEARSDEVQAKREAMKLELEEKRAEMDAKREATKLELEEKREKMHNKRIEFQQDVAERKVEHVTKIMLATIERLERIIVRIESRIAKVEARGGSVSESKSFVAAAKVNLSDAKIVIETFSSIDLSSEKAQDNFEKIRVATSEAREHIRATHNNLMLAVRTLSSVEIDVGEEDSTEQ
ncbi:MAG: hypothetical protein A3C62_00415 [Candidatus Zambryskibacteria bacterium RIFCSPHIGHO2_02_FULL_39_16]|nr:MAG: hypothetical protein A3C62_00415 [Candidatus Zambryskibacteria bacterium RIFCSPHIGHO2_02_FULL_39_16]